MRCTGMDELKIIIAQPFKVRGKSRLTPTEFSFALTMDLKWLTPDESRQALDEGLKTGLLQEEKGKIAPTFDYRSQAVPDGFKPGIFFLSKKPLMESIYELLEQSGLDKMTAKSLAEEKQKALNNMVTAEVAGLIIAKERGLDVLPYIDDTMAQLLGK